MAEILYPYAYHNGELTHIADAESSVEYTCLMPRCSGAMIPKMGKVKRHHFAHKSEAEASLCVRRETYLHRASILAIEQGFKDAVAGGFDYKLRHYCYPHNRPIWEKNLAKSYTQVTVESTAVDATRSDLRFEGPGVKPLVIEVVVSHGIEPATFARYEKAGVILVDVSPTLESLDSYAAGPVVVNHVCFEPVQCEVCATVERNKAKADAISGDPMAIDPCSYVRDRDLFWCTTHRWRTTHQDKCYGYRPGGVVSK